MVCCQFWRQPSDTNSNINCRAFCLHSVLERYRSRETALRFQKTITTATVLTALWAVIHLLKLPVVCRNCQSSWITSNGRPTAGDFISYPSQLECEFAMNR